MNTKLRTDAKNDFEKDFFKLMNNAVFGKTMENERKHRGIKLVTTNKRRKYFVSEPNYHTKKCFSEHLLTTGMKKTKVKMYKPVYLGLSILEISKTLCMSFGITILNQSIGAMQNYATWIQIALSCIFKLKMFFKTFQMMLKKIYHIKLWIRKTTTHG